MKLKTFFTTYEKGKLFTIQTIDFTPLKKKLKKNHKLYSGKKNFIIIGSFYILCLLYGLIHNFYMYYAEINAVGGIIPSANEEEQLKLDSVYINGDFVLDLYSYKELLDNGFLLVYNKQKFYNDKGNLPKNKILKINKRHFLEFEGYNYLDNILFKKKLLTSKTHASLIKTYNKQGKDIILDDNIYNNAPTFKTKVFSVDYDSEDNIITNNRDGTHSIINIKKIYNKGISDNYTLSGDQLRINILDKKLNKKNKYSVCDGFVRPDCKIFESFFRNHDDFYYIIRVILKNVQPGDTLSITTK